MIERGKACGKWPAPVLPLFVSCKPFLFLFFSNLAGLWTFTAWRYPTTGLGTSWEQCCRPLAGTKQPPVVDPEAGQYLPEQRWRCEVRALEPGACGLKQRGRDMEGMVA